MPSKIYDTHPHIIANDPVRYPIAPLGGIQSKWSQERPVTAEQMVKIMGEAGVDKAAMVHSSTTYGYDNSYMTDSIAKYPTKFTGVGSIDVLAPDAVEKLEYWRPKGVCGLRIFTIGTTITTQQGGIYDERAFPVWDHCGNIGMSICLQMSPDGYADAVQMIKKFPKVKVFIDHHGRADVTDGAPYAKAQAMFDMAQFKNVYIKLTSRSMVASANGKATPDTFFPRMVKEFGADRLAWGSNYPADDLGDLKAITKLSLERLSVLPEADQEWVFWKTAEILYPPLAKM